MWFYGFTTIPQHQNTITPTYLSATKMTKLQQNTHPFSFKPRWWIVAFVVLFVIGYYFCLPKPLFQDPTSVILTDASNRLIGAKIAADEQWRFPPADSLPQKFITAICTYEDKRFFSHWGVDGRSLLRAIHQNIKAGKIISGASTLSMQVIRLARKGQPRTIWEKLKEMVLATRLEWRYTKKEILLLYASHAPFGGNVVGLETATWRYYGKPPHLLTWAEAATLAVLPNSPALIHPGRNRTALLHKRNQLLDKLFELGAIEELSWELAKEEKLPNKPLALPRLAPHLIETAILDQPDETESIPKMVSTLQTDIQKNATAILEKHHSILKGNGIYNAASLMIDVEQNQVIAYVGNIEKVGFAHGAQVDIIKAPRSTGSILKPFLYAGLLQEGTIVPNSLIPDLPTQMNGYQPKNFYETYDGVVTAKRALIRSLNIPFIKLLQEYGLEKFHFLLQKMGLSTLHQPANYYGLPLILGGAEASLWDLTNAYAALARTLNHFSDNSGTYNINDWAPAQYLYQESSKENLETQTPVLDAASIYYTFEAMRQVERPDEEGVWEQFASDQAIAWKTGTSIGFRDAWAIGVTPQYAIGVWVGNADGEGRPNLTGIQTAAPILFDLFDVLPVSDWFVPPYDELATITTCTQSGYRALPICPVDSIVGPAAGTRMASCPYHRTIHLDKSRRWQVNSNCSPPSEMIHESWFVLPPGEAHYYRFRSPTYQSLPPIKKECLEIGNDAPSPMDLIYPKIAKQIFVPKDLTGDISRTVFKVAHQHPSAIIYWHLDNTYLGSTQTFHQFELNPAPGKHLLTLVDEYGYQLERDFEIVRK